MRNPLRMVPPQQQGYDDQTRDPQNWPQDSSPSRDVSNKIKVS